MIVGEQVVWSSSYYFCHDGVISFAGSWASPASNAFSRLCAPGQKPRALEHRRMVSLFFCLYFFFLFPTQTWLAGWQGKSGSSVGKGGADHSNSHQHPSEASAGS